jgi:glycosyltransferase involved in cell wall biosynthesis
MEILFVSHKYPPATGGMEKQSFELINGVKRYAKVHTLVYEGKENRMKFFLKLNGRINRLCKTHPGISVIHFNDALIAAVSLTHRGYGHLKRTMTVHGLDVVFPSFLYQRVILPRFNRFDLIIAVSEATRNACIARNIQKDKVVVIQNGVDTVIKARASRIEINTLLRERYFLESTGKHILVAMGRPVKRKGFSWFIRNVMPALHKDFILLLIGPAFGEAENNQLFQLLPGFLRKRMELFLGYPSDAVHIRALLKDPAISQRVRHLGKLPLKELTDIISVADAYVMPNIPLEGDMEGFGLVCLEAAMCGTRVFASRLEGITDAIHHEKNGFLVPPADASAWIATLNQLRAVPNNFDLPPDHIVSFTRHTFSWQRMTDRYMGAFMKLVNKKETTELNTIMKP